MMPSTVSGIQDFQWLHMQERMFKWMIRRIENLKWFLTTEMQLSLPTWSLGMTPTKALFFGLKMSSRTCWDEPELTLLPLWRKTQPAWNITQLNNESRRPETIFNPFTIDLLHESLFLCVHSGQLITGVTSAYQRAQGNKDSWRKSFWVVFENKEVTSLWWRHKSFKRPRLEI